MGVILMKKILSIILALSILLCCIGTTNVFAKSYSGKCGDNLRWELNGNTLSITGTGQMYDYAFVGNTNRAPWIEYQQNIEHVVIGNGVETVGVGAFGSSENLISVSLPNTLKEIKKHAFSVCNKLSSVDLPESLVSIGDFAFSMDSNIKKVIIPGGVKEISYNAFGCCGVEEVIISEGVEVIGESAFTFCSSLKSVTIPNSITSIKSEAFSVCRNLKSVNIPRGVSVDNSAFEATTRINYVDNSAPIQDLDSKLNTNSPFLELKNHLVNNGELNNGDYVVNCYTNEKKDNSIDIVYTPNNNMVKLLYIYTQDDNEYIVTLSIDAVKKDYNANCRMNINVDNSMFHILMDTTINASSVCEDYIIPKNSFEIYNANNECITNLFLDITPELKNSSYTAFGSAIYSMILSLSNYLAENELGISEKDFGFVNIKNINRSDTFDSTELLDNNQIKVILNGKLINFDVQPVNIEGRILVPIRAIFEALGATVDWNGEKKEVLSTKGDITIKMYQDDTTMYRNGQSITLDVPAKNIDGRILVPVRVISESFNLQVGWDGNTKTVSIIGDSNKFVMLYTIDGSSKAFDIDLVENQLSAGWYTEPVIKMYAVENGNLKTITVLKSQVDANKQAGWRTDMPNSKQSKVNCNDCNGSGRKNCQYCDGLGVIIMFDGFLGSDSGGFSFIPSYTIPKYKHDPCVWCSESGKVKCDSCNGEGKISTTVYYY